MIITRSPLRITLGGGGTDLPSFYQFHEGYVLSAAIDKYVYCSINRPFSSDKILKYADYERVNTIYEIKHPIIRECLRYFNSETVGIEISTMADLPSGTGLGSSGSFTTALLKALSIYYSKPIHAHDLAELACKIEIDILNEPIGKQDQYIAAYGGFTEFRFSHDESVNVKCLDISRSTIHDLEDNLLLFYTGKSRSASNILKDQDDKSKSKDKQILDNLQYIKELGLKSRDALINGNLLEFSNCMNDHWEYKKSRSPGISSKDIDEAFQYARQNGASGGKLVGAGGGGFLMFYANDIEKLRAAMYKKDMPEVRFKFDFEGTAVVLHQ